MKEIVSRIALITTVEGIQEDPKQSAEFLTAVYNPDGMKPLKVVPGASLPVEPKDIPDWQVDVRSKMYHFISQWYQDHGGPPMMNTSQHVTTGTGIGGVDLMKNPCAVLCDVRGTESSEAAQKTAKNVAKVLRKAHVEMDMVLMGPLTNFAAWLENDETAKLIESKVGSIWIMGGNLPMKEGEVAPNTTSSPNDVSTSASTSSTQGGKDEKKEEAEETAPTTHTYEEEPYFKPPEFNFAMDPVAASNVFNPERVPDSILNKIHILPWETCLPTITTPSEKSKWSTIVEMAQSYKEECKNCGPHHHNNVMLTRIIKALGDDYDGIKYDPLTAFAYARPNSIKMESIPMRVDPSSGLVVRGDSEDKDEDGTATTAGMNEGVTSRSSRDETLKTALCAPCTIKFVTDVQLDGSDGFLESWLYETIKREQRGY